MNNLKRIVFLAVVAIFFTGCQGKSNTDDDNENKEFKVASIQSNILLTGKKTALSSEFRLGRSIEIIVNQQDLLIALPEAASLTSLVDFDKKTLVLIQSEQRANMNDFAINLGEVTDYDNDSFKNYTEVAINYAETKNCILLPALAVHYLLFSIDKPHNYLLFKEKLNYQNCN